MGFLLLEGRKQLVAQIVSVYEGLAGKTNKSRDDYLQDSKWRHKSLFLALAQFFDSISSHWSFLALNTVLNF